MPAIEHLQANFTVPHIRDTSEHQAANWQPSSRYETQQNFDIADKVVFLQSSSFSSLQTTSDFLHSEVNGCTCCFLVEALEIPG